MALKLGFEAIKYIFTKALTKKGVKGIARIPGKAYDMRMRQLVDSMATKMRDLGYDVNKVTEKEVQGLLDSAEALEKQKSKKGLVGLKKYTDEQGRTWDFSPKVEGKPFDLFPGANLKAVPKTTIDEHITFIKSQDPIESMKEANKIIGRKNPSYKGRYKNLTDDEAKKILKDTEDHIFQRDIQYDEFGDPIKPEPEDFQSGGLAYMLGEPNTRIEALQHAGVVADPRGLYTDPSIYSKGESEVQNYYEGGGVGQGPWTKGQAPRPPQQPPQAGAPMHPAQGQSNPMKLPQGLPSLAPRTMDPRVMQQQRMQQMMAGTGQQGQPRRGMDVGGMTQDDFDRYLRERKQRDKEYFKGDFLDDFEKWKKHQKDRTVPVAEGGRIGFGFGSMGGGPSGDKNLPFPTTVKMKKRLQATHKWEFDKGKTNFKDFYDWFWDNPELNLGLKEGGRASFGLGSLSRRTFLKMMAAIAALPLVGKGVTKVAPKVIPKVTETVVRGADGMPTYITDLIEVVKAKGARDFIEGVKRSDYSTVHRYKGVEVIEDGAGNIKIKSDKSGVATDPYTGKTHEGIAQENHIQIEKGAWIEPELTKTGKVKKKSVKTKDEYIEGTVYPDMDGKMKDWEDGLDEAIHLDFKKIADEKKAADFLDIKMELNPIKKASGGLAYMLGE